jgi:hypothetical protein
LVPHPTAPYAECDRQIRAAADFPVEFTDNRNSRCAIRADMIKTGKLIKDIDLRVE